MESFDAMKAMRRRIALPKRPARNSSRAREKTKLELLRRRMELPKKKSRRDFSTARFRLKTIGANQASVFFVALADF